MSNLATCVSQENEAEKLEVQVLETREVLRLEHTVIS
jgi:hypothetical protein